MKASLRVLGIGLLTCALLFAAAGSTGLSLAQAERGVSISVVDQDSAYVGYDSPEAIHVTSGNESAIVIVTNRLHSPVDVTNVEVDSSADLTITDVTEPQSIDPGESGEIEARIDCEEDREAEVYVTITVEANGVTATIFGYDETRAIAVECLADS